MSTTRTEDKHVALDSVKINGRFRKDLGDLEELKASIQDVGLLQPVVVTPDHTLVCGARRLEALRQLGWSSVPVTIKDDPTEAWLLEAERDENICRLDMKPLELLALTQALIARLRVETDAAEVRRKAARKGAETKRNGSNSNPNPVAPPRYEGVIDKAARAAGWSRFSYDRARKIVERAGDGEEAAQEALEEMERTGKVKPAWRKLNDEPPRPKPPIKLETDRQHSVANARKNRVAKAVYGLEGMCSGLEEADLRYVVVAATPEELDEWDRLLGSATKTLGALRRGLKTERGVA